MSVINPSIEKPTSPTHGPPRWLGNLPGVKNFNNLSIGSKLNIGFGILVMLTLLVVGLILIASRKATQNINLTETLRVPTALASTRAQSSLLKMQASVRGYLVLSDLQNIDDYNKAKELFEVNLAELEALSANWTDTNDIRRLKELKTTFEAWAPIPERLFELHDNARENQPALRLASLELQPLMIRLYDQVDRLIDLQEQQEPSIENRELLADMVDLKTSFQAMATNLRAYATSGDMAFKFGYAANLSANSLAWKNLQNKEMLLDSDQEILLNNIATRREQLLPLPRQIFEAVEGQRTYEDLYLFKTEAEPGAERMLQLLDEMTAGQQALLQADLNKGRQSLTNVQFQTISGGLLALILGVAMAFIFKENIAGPVRRLIKTSELISAGDLGAQARVESHDEIGRLATTINIMTGRLRDTIGSLEKQTQQLETASRAKSDFLASMSHELRTPLNGILGYAQILQRDASLRTSQSNAVTIIQKSGEHLLTLINDILDLSKIEARKMELYPADFVLPNFLDGIVGMFRMRVQQKPGVSFSYTALTSLPSVVRADEKRLRQILINLLGNAIKFTDRGEVTFRVGLVETDRQAAVGRSSAAAELRPGRRQLKPQPAACKLLFEVADTGIGITPEQLERIFLPFEQAGEFQRRADGTGLGLAISKHLVQLMQGQLEVESEFGTGSTFRLVLELPVIQFESEHGQTVGQDIVGYKGPRRRILIVDDEADNRLMLVDLLSSVGFEVVGAADGQEAIARARAFQPELILMDLVMPEMSGFEAVQEIRRLPELAARPVSIIAASASAFTSNNRPGVPAGCDEFLIKPIVVESLFALLETHLDLNWICARSKHGAAAQEHGAEADAGDEMLLTPPPEEMAILYDLAMKGAIPQLRKRAARIEQMDRKFGPFARKLRQLVDDFDEDQILDLLERSMRQS